MVLKKCPQCGSIYTDQTLNFCLTDGSTLIIEDVSGKTLELPSKETEQTLAFNSIAQESTAETLTDQKFNNAIKSQIDPGKNVSRF